MNKLSLLRLTDARITDGAAESDLQLNRIFSGDTLRVLCAGSTLSHAETILSRQEIFSKMDDSPFTERLESLRAALFLLAGRLELCKNSRVEFEVICLRLQALAAYRGVLGAVEALDGTARLFDEANAVLREICPPLLKEALEADLVRADELLSGMRSSLFLLNDSIHVADTAWLLADNGEPSFGEQLTELAKRMGFSLTAASTRPVKPDELIGGAYLELYHAEIDSLRQILARYAALDLTAPLCWQRELHFFFEIRDLVKKAAEQGIPSCLPTVAEEKCYRATDVYDITLTGKDCSAIVPNDIDFSADTPVQFLIGANGGGKTTYLRAAGVNLLLFLAGCPIFAGRAEIYPFSAVFTHFPTDETFSGVGRLDSEKLRLDRILEEADDESFLLLNETFSATDEEKGFRLAVETAARLRERGRFCLYVTHFLEVKEEGFPVLSAVVEGTENRRTFKIRRAAGADSSYARDILRKYKLDAASLAKRRHV